MLFDPLTFLVVDDNPGYRELLREELQRHRHHVLEASSLAAAKLELKKARVAVRRIDAISLDLDLGDERGRETFFQTRSESEAIPIVVLTGNGELQVGEDLLKYGAASYLSKGPETPPKKVRRALEAVARKRMTAAKLLGNAARRDADKIAPRDRPTVPPVPGEEPPPHTGTLHQAMSSSLRYEGAILESQGDLVIQVQELTAKMDQLADAVIGNTKSIAETSGQFEAVDAKVDGLGERFKSLSTKDKGLVIGGITLSGGTVALLIELLRVAIEAASGG